MNLKENLKRWGLLRRIKKEMLVDNCLETVGMPNEETKKKDHQRGATAK